MKFRSNTDGGPPEPEHPPDPGQGAESQRAGGAVTGDYAPAEILLVEDSPGDVRLTREALKEAKVQNNLHVAGDGVEALAFLRREGEHREAPRPDLVLLDLNLPRKGGKEVLEAIKDDPDLRAIPVVILTSSEADEDVVRSYDLHANAYVTKPLDLNRFVEVIRQVEGFWLTIVTLPRR